MGDSWTSSSVGSAKRGPLGLHRARSAHIQIRYSISCELIRGLAFAVRPCWEVYSCKDLNGHPTGHVVKVLETASSLDSIKGGQAGTEAYAMYLGELRAARGSCRTWSRFRSPPLPSGACAAGAGGCSARGEFAAAAGSEGRFSAGCAPQSVRRDRHWCCPAAAQIRKVAEQQNFE